MRNKINRCAALAAGSLLLSCGGSIDEGWQHSDLNADGVFGVSSFKAFDEVLQKKPAEPVVVAILDGGFDIKHEALTSLLWTNADEIPNNGMDDDGNGYVDDVHGWNFAGDADSTFRHENLDLTVLVRQGMQRFGNYTMETIPEKDRASFAHFLGLKAKLRQQRQDAKDLSIHGKRNRTTLHQLLGNLGKEAPTLEDIRNYQPASPEENNLRSTLNNALKDKSFSAYYESRERVIRNYETRYRYGLNLDYRPQRQIDIIDGDTVYWSGNPDIVGPDAFHGTVVASVVASFFEKEQLRGTGIVKIMPIRLGEFVQTVDLARGIRYAVDQGAKVISMSLSKHDYMLHKSLLDEAVRYAEAHDVLLVHAAGNSNRNLDDEPSKMTPYDASGEKLANWITVGASGPWNDETIKAHFSNYGKKEVDVFAPGLDIHTAVPGNQYERHDGTSEAAPLVAGVAAILRAYYPERSAAEVREIIMASVTKTPWLAKLCVSGGVVNLYQATQLAENYPKSLKNDDK